MIQTLIKTAIRVFFSGTIYGTRFGGQTDTQATLSCREKRIEEPVKKAVTIGDKRGETTVLTGYEQRRD